MPENLEERWKAAASRVLELFRSDGPAAAFAYLDGLRAELGLGEQPGPPAGFREVAGQLYWQHKALPEFVALSQEAARRLEEARLGADGKPIEEIVRPLGGTLYNLAAFAWPGWDEPGITVGPKELDAGRQGAQRCLEIRLDPAHAGFPFGYSASMAHWVVGAYRLAERDWLGARQQFEEARRLNYEAGKDDILERGYLLLVDLLAHDARLADEAAWERLIAELNGRETDEDAAVYRDQLLSARRVFGG